MVSEVRVIGLDPHPDVILRERGLCSLPGWDQQEPERVPEQRTMMHREVLAIQ